MGVFGIPSSLLPLIFISHLAALLVFLVHDWCTILNKPYAIYAPGADVEFYFSYVLETKNDIAFDSVGCLPSLCDVTGLVLSK